MREEIRKLTQVRALLKDSLVLITNSQETDLDHAHTLIGLAIAKVLVVEQLLRFDVQFEEGEVSEIPF